MKFHFSHVVFCVHILHVHLKLAVLIKQCVLNGVQNVFSIAVNYNSK